MGIVGESGSGKSVTSLSIMGLLPRQGCRVTGEIRFQGKNLLELGQRELEHVRSEDRGRVAVELGRAQQGDEVAVGAEGLAIEGLYSKLAHGMVSSLQKSVCMCFRGRPPGKRAKVSGA